MNPCKCRFVCVAIIVALFAPFYATSQTDFTDHISNWKSQFPKEEFVASMHKEVVSFSLNLNPKPGEGKVKASVVTEMTVVPVKDFLKFTDGLFYNDEIALEQIRVINTKGKEVAHQKLCGSYQDGEIFHSDTKVCSVRFPLDEKGKSFTYTYQSNYRDIKYLTSFYFHNPIPAVEKIIEFRVPAWLESDLREFNFAKAGIEKTSVKENDITRVIYKMKNVPAFHRESSSPNHALSYPHIISVNKAFTDNGQRNVLFESVKDLYAWYKTVCSSIGNEPAALTAKVKELTAGKKTDIEKIESVFYWVQDNIRYIAFEDGIMGFKPDAAQHVLQKKYGDCKGKANLLKEMLKIAGYDARLTWIGTSDLPYDYSLPSLAVDNHMICTIVLNGKRYFLDGTEDYIAFNDYAQRIQGKQVLIEDGDNYIIDRIPDFKAERNKVSRLTKIDIDNNSLKGATAVEYNGESKVLLQRVYSSMRSDQKKDALTGFLKRNDDNIEITNVMEPDLLERQKPLQLNFDFIADNQVTKTGNELYVVMDWDKEFSSMEFPADRKSDYEFNQKYYLNSQTELTIPTGYKVDYLPESFTKVTPDYSFQASYVNKGQSIVYTKTIVVNKPILYKTNFEDWNAFITSINKFYNDQVVLVK
jgi:transglutaminase-like putative cysteine protease